MTTTINADTITGGAIVTGDASGQLGLQAAGNTVLTLNSSRAVGVGATPSYGTSGQVLTSAGSAAAPTWASQSGLSVGTATNIAGGDAGQVPYNTGPNTTSFLAAGTSGQVLQSNGTSAPSWVSPAGGFSSMTVFTSSGTWTVPAGVTKCKVTVTGGGGGTTGGYNCGGGGGGTAIKYLALSGGSITITVGSGGVSASGGTSSAVYGATTIQGSGGSAVGGSAGYAAPGTGSGGTINMSGGWGVQIQTFGSPGGSSYWSGASVFGDTTAFGGGGSVYAAYGSPNYQNGSPGVIVIEY